MYLNASPYKKFSNRISDDVTVQMITFNIVIPLLTICILDNPENRRFGKQENPDEMQLTIQVMYSIMLSSVNY